MSQAENQLTPEGWSNTNIGDFAPLQRGFDLPNRDRIDGNYPVVYSNGVMNFHNTYQVKGPGVITGRSGTIGKVHYVNEDYWPHNTALWVKQFNNAIPKYVYYLYTYIGFDRFSSGSGVPTLNRNDAHSFAITVPTKKEEQSAIANALSDVDALLTELENLIGKKQAIKTATMQQLLTGKTRLPQFATYTEGTDEGKNKGTKPSELGEIPEDWGVQTVYELAEGQKSLFDDGDWIEAEYITDKGVRLIQTGNIGVGSYQEKANKKYISESSFIKLKCKELKQGDLLICRLAEPAGRACIFPDIGEEKIITSVDVTIFRPPVETVNREYLLHYFSTNEWFSSVLEQVGGTTHKRISRGALGRIRVPIPKLAEQTAIATILSDMDNEIQTLEQRLAKTRQIKQGMMQQLLTGRTRLPFKQAKEA
ncbi:restriction endonuclease subunit S [Pseudoalteromonas neustonica]|uniref:Restriction endonuclease subunit S n=1 Tax=Pseudoalteromonas neustonica TaxID=1840331 RepID=A0ABY3F889_9GAMM|nr:restriction endonuclease subunit S [Pseudoalteromonas neustonica]TVU80273.1 restriction endonuclease subunit S [Pseudoalteromonas neustonica]